MLKTAHYEIGEEKLGRLISEEMQKGNGEYYFIGGFHYYNMGICSSSADGIDMVSVNKFGDILGFFGCSFNFHKKRIDNVHFFKFKDNICNEEDAEVFNKDIEEFFLKLISDKRFSNVFFNSIKENRANGDGRRYFSWLQMYGGERFLVPEYSVDLEGNLHDMYIYKFKSLWRR